MSQLLVKPTLPPARPALERSEASARVPRILLGVALAAIAVAVALIVVGAAGEASRYVSEGQPVPIAIRGPLSGLGGALTPRYFVALTLVMTASYLAVVVGSRLASPRWAVATIVAVNVLVVLGPPLLSTDVFGYAAYGRLGALHGLSPYVHGPDAISGDPIYRYLTWHHITTPYGPLFTLVSYPLAKLGVAGSLWGFKLMTAAASLGLVAMVWRCARQRGRDPVPAAMIVGLNPVLLLFGVAGAHNDLLMLFLAMAGVSLVLADRERVGAAAIVAGAAVKATAVVLLPFMLIGRRRRVDVVVGAVLALAAVGLVAYAAFGAHGLSFLGELRKMELEVSGYSFPNHVVHLLGRSDVSAGDRIGLRIALAATVLYLLVATWRGYDWLAAAGWALLALAVTTTWLLGWYTLWALPLAAIARDRRLLVATLAVEGLFLANQLPPAL